MKRHPVRDSGSLDMLKDFQALFGENGTPYFYHPEPQPSAVLFEATLEPGLHALSAETGSC